MPPGAALFSVPMASAPHAGIYNFPEEMFRIRDLDAGKEYSLDQVRACRRRRLPVVVLSGGEARSVWVLRVHAPCVVRAACGDRSLCVAIPVALRHFGAEGRCFGRLSCRLPLNQR